MLLPFRTLLVAAMAVPLLFAGACDRRGTSQPDAQPERIDALADELEAINAEQTERSLRQLDEEGGLELDTSHIDALDDATQAQRKQATGTEKAFLDVMGEFTGGMRSAASDYASVTSNFAAAGGMNPASITSEDDVLDRITLAEDCVKANAEYGERVQRLFAEQPDKIRALASRGVPQQNIDSYIRGFEGTDPHKLERISAVRATDDTIFRRAVDMLTILHDYYGLWWVNHDGRITFDATVPRETISLYNTALGEIQQAAAEQARIQREQLEAAQTP